MKHLMGIEYGRGATAVVVNDGPARGPGAVRAMYPDANWTTVVPDEYDPVLCVNDRFGDCFQIQKKIVASTPLERHVMIGGDHSVNFGHFTALVNRMPDEDLCLVYIDAHLDIHTPESSLAQASGAPHGTNVRALLGDGDSRWLSLQMRRPALRPENIFYLGIRSYEPAEIDYIHSNNIFYRGANEIQTLDATLDAIEKIKRHINSRKYVVSFDFDAIDPKYFSDVLVPEPNGISPEIALELTRAFAPHAHSFEFVEYAPTGDVPSAQIARTLIGTVLDVF